MKEEKIESPIVYKSKETTPDGNPFMTVKKARDYYYYAERGGINSIAFILYDSVTQMFGLINESKPPLDEILNEKAMMITAFGGSCDMEKSNKEICKIEVLEESGFDVPIGSITSVGTTLVSSQMSQKCELFLVNVSGIKKSQKAEYEDKESEFGRNSVIWMNSDELMNNDDWKSIFIISKSIIKNLI